MFSWRPDDARRPLGTFSVDDLVERGASVDEAKRLSGIGTKLRGQMALYDWACCRWESENKGNAPPPERKDEHDGR